MANADTLEQRIHREPLPDNRHDRGTCYNSIEDHWFYRSRQHRDDELNSPISSYVAMSGESQSDCPLWKSASAHIAAVSDAQCRKRGEGLLCGDFAEKLRFWRKLVIFFAAQGGSTFSARRSANSNLLSRSAISQSVNHNLA